MKKERNEKKGKAHHMPAHLLEKEGRPNINYSPVLSAAGPGPRQTERGWWRRRRQGGMQLIPHLSRLIWKPHLGCSWIGVGGIPFSLISSNLHLQEAAAVLLVVSS